MDVKTAQAEAARNRKQLLHLLESLQDLGLRFMPAIQPGHDVQVGDQRIYVPEGGIAADCWYGDQKCTIEELPPTALLAFTLAEFNTFWEINQKVLHAAWSQMATTHTEPERGNLILTLELNNSIASTLMLLGSQVEDMVCAILRARDGREPQPNAFSEGANV